MSDYLLVRADASPQIGTGHVMRCLALAQVWQDRGGRAVFACAELSPALRDRLQTEGCAVEAIAVMPGSSADLTATVALAKDLAAAWVVFDGYQFDGGFQQALKDAGLRVLVVDDYGHSGSYPADVVLNQNLGAAEGLYTNRSPSTRLLLGPRYALLRREFASTSGWERSIPEVAVRILVTLGGADPDNVTLTVIEALGQIRVEGLEAIVVVGGANPHRQILESAARRSPTRIDLRVNVTDMPSLMRWADMAVAAGGTTAWELAACGLPGVIMVLAENQRKVAEACDRDGLSENLGCYVDVSAHRLAERLERLMRLPTARAMMVSKMASLVDTRGAARVVRELAGPPSVKLRLATLDDIRIVWEWANDPTTRAASFSASTIPWDSHTHWFAGKLSNPNCLFLIAEVDGPVGQVRFDLSGEKAVISVGLAPNARARGYGAVVIKKAIEYLMANHRIQSVEAQIRPGNTASIRAFSAAGFCLAGNDLVHDQPALRYLFS